MKHSKQKLQSTYPINISVSFIDYCNVNNIDIDLVKYYQWKLHLKKEQQKTWKKLYGTSYAR
jgi:hypothetical protein